MTSPPVFKPVQQPPDKKQQGPLPMSWRFWIAVAIIADIVLWYFVLKLENTPRARVQIAALAVFHLPLIIALIGILTSYLVSQVVRFNRWLDGLDE